MTAASIKSVSLAVCIALGVLSMTACASGEGEGKAAEPAPTVTATVTATPSSSPSPTENEATQSKPEPNSKTFVMPNEVGKNLQAAQDHIQRVSDNPFFFTSSKDATSDNRMQLLDRDWQVCSQNVAPGTTADKHTDIVFAVVKTYEECP